MDSASLPTSLGEATSGAAAYLTEQLADGGQPPHPEPQAPEPQAPPDSQPGESDETPSAPAPSDSVEIDWNGERIRLTRDEHEKLVQFALSAYQQAQQRQQQPQAQAPRQQAQPQQQPDKVMQMAERLERLEAQLLEANTARERERIQGNIDAALGKLDAYSKAEHDDDRELLRSLTSLNIYGNPQWSPHTAAQKASERLEQYVRRNHARYVQDKVQAAAHKVAKGGSAASTPGKPFNRSDLVKGNIVDRSIEFLKKASGR